MLIEAPRVSSRIASLMAGEGAPGAIVLGAGVPRLASAATRSGWLRSWSWFCWSAAVAVLGCVAALLTLHGGTVGRATMARHGLESLPLTAQGPVSAALGRDEGGVSDQRVCGAQPGAAAFCAVRALRCRGHGSCCAVRDRAQSVRPRRRAALARSRLAGREREPRQLCARFAARVVDQWAAGVGAGL